MTKKPSGCARPGSYRLPRVVVNPLQTPEQLPDDSSRDHGTGHLSDQDMAFDPEQLRRDEKNRSKKK